MAIRPPDAMVSPRPYRAASSREQAVEELRRAAGTQFDPSVVAALIAVLAGQRRDGAPVALARSA